MIEIDWFSLCANKSPSKLGMSLGSVGHAPARTTAHTILMREARSVGRMQMAQTSLAIVLICFVGIVFADSDPNGIEAESVWQNNSDHSFMWWAYGLRDPSKVFNIQTSHFGLSFDFDDFELKTFGPIANVASAEDVLLQDNRVVEGLSHAALRCVIERKGMRYEASNAGPAWTDCMLVESGRFFQRRWLEKLTFAGTGRGGPPPAKSRLEISAWPDRITFVLYVEPEKTVANGALEIMLNVGDMYATLSGENPAFGLFDPAGNGFVFLTDDPNATLICDAGQMQCTVRLETGATWPAGMEHSVGLVVYPVSKDGPNALEQVIRSESEPIVITAQQTKPVVEDLFVTYDPRHGWHSIGLRNDQCGDYAQSGNDRMEQVTLRLTNPDERARQVRLNFAKDGEVCSVTGLSAMLCDSDLYPLGVPIQISKNWHGEASSHRFAGAWYHGLTMLTVPPRSTLDLVYRSVNGHWGGVAAASHAQLCLVGWGSHQLWDEAAIGAWGESLCFEPDQGQIGGAVLDSRPLMVGRPWHWTNNVGGADFLVYYDASGRKQWNSRMKTMYRRYCPNLTEVTYAGRSADAKIDLKYTVSLFRTDDIVRGVYRFRYDVRDVVDFNRLVLFQCGADHYSYTGERLFARGNEQGLVQEWLTRWGGNVYRADPVELEGRIPWLSMHDAVPREAGATTANRGLVIRCWDAVLGGQPAKPWVAERGARVRGVDTSLMDILPPAGLTQLLPGDYVEGEMIHVIMPKYASDYYGPNIQLATALDKNENTWRMTHREAIGNDLDISVTKGTLEHVYPIRINASKGAEFVVTGGLGYVPMTFSGLPDYRKYTLQKKGDDAWERVDQSVHGRDSWQTDYDAETATWEMTYTVPLDRPDDIRTPTEFRFLKETK